MIAGPTLEVGETVTVRYEAEGRVIATAAYHRMAPGLAAILAVPADGQARTGDEIVDVRASSAASATTPPTCSARSRSRSSRSGHADDGPGLQPLPGRADDAGVHPGVAGLSLEEKGFVLGAALARMTPADAKARIPGEAGARCAAVLAALGDEAKPARVAAIAALTALVRAPVPAGIERVHPDWLRERFEGASSAVVRAVAAGLPETARAVAAEVLRARGDEARGPGSEITGDGVAALQRVVFGGLVPLDGPGGPSTPVARELAALAPAELTRAIELRGAEALGRSLRGAPADVVARAAASVGATLAPVVLEATRAAGGDGDAAARDEARRQVVAAGAPAAGEIARDVGLQALAALLESEGGSAIMAVAQRLPLALGRRLLSRGDDE